MGEFITVCVVTDFDGYLVGVIEAPNREDFEANLTDLLTAHCGEEITNLQYWPDELDKYEPAQVRSTYFTEDVFEGRVQESYTVTCQLSDMFFRSN